MGYGNPLRHVQAVHDYVEAHLNERIGVSDIAQALGMNASYLNTSYRRSTGGTVSAYIRWRKAEYAKQLLRQQPEYSIAQVCGMLGYFDQSHFTRAFKAAVGCTPGEFRGNTVNNKQKSDF